MSRSSSPEIRRPSVPSGRIRYRSLAAYVSSVFGPPVYAIQRPSGDTDGFDHVPAVLVRPVPVLAHEPGEDDLTAVGHPVDARAEPEPDEQVAHHPLTLGQRPGRAAHRRDHVQVVGPVIEEAPAVEPVVDPVDLARARRPFRAFGTGRHVHRPLLLVGDEERERDPLAVRGPAEVRRRLLGVGHLRDGTLGVHPPHVDLGPAVVVRGHEGDAGPVGRPAGRAPVDEEPLPSAVGVHDPELRVPAVAAGVHAAPGIEDPVSVRRDLHTAHPLPLQEAMDGEAVVPVRGRALLGGEGGRDTDRQDRDEGGRQASGTVWASGTGQV
jgi:hypothetical protein